MSSILSLLKFSGRIADLYPARVGSIPTGGTNIPLCENVSKGEETQIAFAKFIPPNRTRCVNLTVNQTVVGSNPTGGANFYRSLVQW